MTSRLVPALLFAGLGLAMGLSTPARADTIYLKAGGLRVTEIERFSDGAFWVKDGKRTVILKPEEILKILFAPEEKPPSARPAQSGSGAAPAPPARKTPGPRSSAEEILSIPSASARTDAPAEPTNTDSDSAAARLVIVNYRTLVHHGIFQVVGEIENTSSVEERYVKVTVALLDSAGSVVDQNFSYVRPAPPHLAAGACKNFSVSFLHPPTSVSKYKIRVESSRF